MGAISLVSILAETGVAALSTLGQGAMFVADNLDFILPVLAAVALGLAVLHRQAILAGIASVGSALASAAGWAAAHWPVLLLIAVLGRGDDRGPAVRHRDDRGMRLGRSGTWDALCHRL